MSKAKITLIGFYQYMHQIGNDLFSEIELPDVIDKELVIDTILQNNAEFEALYTDPYFMQTMIGIWSKKWKRTFERWYEALIESEYNPVENYDRKEEWTDNGTSSGTDSSSGNVENKTSAFDSPTYQPEAKTESSTNGQTSATSQNIHSGRVHGNIGVTTSAQMIAGDVTTHQMYNLYNMIADCFKHELLIAVY